MKKKKRFLHKRTAVGSACVYEVTVHINPQWHSQGFTWGGAQKECREAKIAIAIYTHIKMAVHTHYYYNSLRAHARVCPGFQNEHIHIADLRSCILWCPLKELCIVRWWGHKPHVFILLKTIVGVEARALDIPPCTYETMATNVKLPSVGVCHTFPECFCTIVIGWRLDRLSLYNVHIITWPIILFVNSCNFTVPERFGEVKADVCFTKEGIPQVTFMIEVMLDPNVLYNVIIIATYVISWDTIIQHLQTVSCTIFLSLTYKRIKDWCLLPCLAATCYVPV